MTDINFTSAKIAALALDTQASTNKTLTDLLNELQTGSILKGTVSEITKDGHAIFTTKIGKFIVENKNDLKGGDRIAVKVLQSDQPQLTCKLVSINNENTNNRAAKLELTLITRQTLNAEPPHVHTYDSAPVNIQKPLSTLKSVQAVVVYKNNSQLNKDSSLYDIFKNLEVGNVIECEVVHNTNLKSPSYHQITGTVTNNDNLSKQLIKTVFGILSIEAPLTLLPIGKELHFAIKTINNIPLNLEHIPIKSDVADFLFKLNHSLPVLEQLKEVILKLTTINPPQPINNNIVDLKATQTTYSENSLLLDTEASSNHKPSMTKDHNRQPYNQQLNDLTVIKDTQQQSLQDIRELFKIINDKNQVKELAIDFEKIKSSLITERVDSDNLPQWCILYLPIIDNDQLKKHKIFFKRTAQLVRFIVSVNAENIGELQLDGLLKIAANNKQKVESFDLIIRFKDLVNKQLQEDIGQIFLYGQGVSGIAGSLNFEAVAELTFPDDLSEPR
ncbi:hypothetical protein Trichorick_00232 [Candidatus Trichorickettsia mobilis]|uniref:Uncharacterized protein n=1 Tax=Candidatus Trichorickettsia mobilis TaxID=1346319 RepID=A0ABZ0UWC3_9RICK|nr:hypothetical protein [Candidatus Trichorickettsia mobilis]WPY00359.1 hypothetical protein Trichorick_00232 [Candidatus Trichorickettsia mobilis]